MPSCSAWRLVAPERPRGTSTPARPDVLSDTGTDAADRTLPIDSGVDVVPAPDARSDVAPDSLADTPDVTDGADALLRTAISRLGLSARAYHRILKIARTIADLEGAADLQPKHVSEAIQYRTLDRRGVA